MASLTARVGPSDAPGTNRPASKDGVFVDAVRALNDHAQVEQSGLVDLEQELAVKSSLVETLTEQLERAAEEIDRMQRSGADRRRGGGLPVDLVDDQRQLMADMQRVVQQWEDLQAGFALGRIEVQLTELRDFVGERLVATSHLPTDVESSNQPHMFSEPVSHGGSRQFQHEKEAPPAAENSVSAWEQLKTQMLGNVEDALDSEVPIAAQKEPLPPAPEPIDGSLTDVTALQAAVFDRDAYIATLLRRLRAAEELTLPEDWSQLTAADPDLAESLQKMSQRLEETLRMAEVELSLERAQVARAQMHVAAQQDLITKHLKRLGLSSIDQLGGVNNAAAAGANDRRWSRFLGGGKKS